VRGDPVESVSNVDTAVIHNRREGCVCVWRVWERREFRGLSSQLYAEEVEPFPETLISTPRVRWIAASERKAAGQRKWQKLGVMGNSTLHVATRRERARRRAGGAAEEGERVSHNILGLICLCTSCSHPPLSDSSQNR